jgi:hypothetical protein
MAFKQKACELLEADLSSHSMLEMIDEQLAALDRREEQILH